MSLYDDLGVAKDAAKDAIKGAYKHMAGKHHPDRPDGDEEKFKTVQRAYMILRDPEKRKRYDDTGETQGKPNIEDMARDLIVSMFMKAAQQNSFKKSDYVAVVLNHLTIALSKDTGTAAELQKTHDDVLYLVDHMKGDEKLAARLQVQVDSIAVSRKQCLEHIELVKTATLIIKRCTYDGGEEVDEWVSAQPFYTGAGHFPGSTAYSGA